MFNFFNKKIESPQQSEDQNHIASISYKITEDGKIYIDMAVEEYSQKSMLALFDILDILYDEKSIFETVNILKDNLIKDNQTVWLEELVKHTAKHFMKKSNALRIHEDNIINSQPCIKPSDVIK